MPPPPPTFQATLVSSRSLAPGVRELVFARDDGAPMKFEAGQWLSIALPVAHEGGSVLRRSYSIASPPNETPRFEIAVTHVDGGPGSSYLHALEAGASLPFTGPQGFFTRPVAKTGPSLFVGTGTGVTPLRSMLKNAVACGETRPLWLLFGARREADLLYRDEWAALETAHANVRVFYTLSRDDAPWEGRRGYVQTHVRDLFRAIEAEGHATPHAYICGLEKMVSAVRELLRKDMAVPREHVHSERYD